MVGIARKIQRLEAFKQRLPENLRNNVHGLVCDVSDEEQIIATFEQIDRDYGAISVLVNCASSFKYGNLLDKENTEDMKNVIDVNLFGTIFCTREVFLLMRKRKIDDGQIININSFLGHKIPYIPRSQAESSWNIFPASKHAVIAFNEILRQELTSLKSKIKLTVSIFFQFTDYLINIFSN